MPESAASRGWSRIVGVFYDSLDSGDPFRPAVRSLQDDYING